MKKLLIIFTLFCTFISAANVVVRIDRNKIILEEVLTLTLEVEGSTQSPKVNISSIEKDFTIVGGPYQQTSFNSINGQIKTSLTYSWSITANRLGTLIIPSFTVRVGNTNYKTNPVKIEVKKNSVQPQSNDIFITVELDKDTAYPGEQITIEYKLYTKTTDIAINNLVPPEFVGFWVEKIFEATRLNYHKVRLNGEQYQMARLFTYALFPTKTGDIDIPEMTVKCNVAERRKSSRRSVFDSFFDDPFFGRQKTTTKILRTQKKMISIHPFPNGAPSDFQGVVGEFGLQARVDRTTLPENDAVTLKLELRGTGNIALINIPEIKFSEALEVFPPTMDIKKDPFRDQITGTIQWELILIPRRAGKFSIPRIEIPYFNPKKESWERVGTNPILLTVTPSKIPASTSNGFRKEEVELLGKDIRYFRMNVKDWKSIKSHNSVSKLIPGIYVLTLILLLLPFGLKNYYQSRESSFEDRKSKHAIRLVQKKLKRKSDDIFTQVSDAIYLYLRDKFYLSSEQLDPHSVQMRLNNEIREDELTQLVAVLNFCDAGRYAPNAEEAKVDLIEKTVKLLKRIDKHG